MEVGSLLFIFLITGLVAFFILRDLFGLGDPAVSNSKRLAKEAKANKSRAIAPQKAAEMQDPDYLKKRLEVDPYEKAMKELESGDIDKAVWAKAFSQGDNDDTTRRLYVKLRAEILQGELPLVVEDNQDLEEKKPFQLFSLQGFAYLIAIVPPSSLVGAWFFNAANDLPTRFMEVASGQAWLAFVLWPFAIGYILWKKNQAD